MVMSNRTRGSFFVALSIVLCMGLDLNAVSWHMPNLGMSSVTKYAGALKNIASGLLGRGQGSAQSALRHIRLHPKKASIVTGSSLLAAVLVGAAGWAVYKKIRGVLGKSGKFDNLNEQYEQALCENRNLANRSSKLDAQLEELQRTMAQEKEQSQRGLDEIARERDLKDGQLNTRVKIAGVHSQLVQRANARAAATAAENTAREMAALRDSHARGLEQQRADSDRLQADLRGEISQAREQARQRDNDLQEANAREAAAAERAARAMEELKESYCLKLRHLRTYLARFQAESNDCLGLVSR